MHLVLTSFHRGMYIPSACSDSCDSTGHKSLNYPAATSQDHLRVGRSAGRLISLQLISTSHLVTSVPTGGSNNDVLWSTENKGYAQASSAEIGIASSLHTSFSNNLGLWAFFLLQISSTSLLLSPFSASSWAKPSPGWTQLFTFFTSIAQLLSTAGKTTHPADDAIKNYGHQHHLGPCYCWAALPCSPGQLTLPFSHFSIIMTTGSLL